MSGQGKVLILVHLRRIFPSAMLAQVTPSMLDKKSNKKKEVVSYEIAVIPSDGTAARTFSDITLGKVIAAVSALCGTVAVLAALIIALTPLRQLIPGYGDAKRYEQQLLANQARLDSLSGRLVQFDIFSRKLKTMLSVAPRDSTGNLDARSKLVASPARNNGFRPIVSTELYAAPAPTPSENPLGIVVQGTLSQEFRPSKSHYGLDIATALNEPVSAFADGTVLFADWTTDYGYTLIISHGLLVSFYKHCNRLLVREGEVVRRGQPVALAGSTGRESSAPHLHLEIWKDGVPQNPALYIAE